jgi:hypothetical protein
MNVKPVALRVENEPHFLKAAGPQLDQKLLTPAQRREALEYEKRKFES